MTGALLERHGAGLGLGGTALSNPTKSYAEIESLLRCDAPGVILRECPCFSAMEGTGTYALHLKDKAVRANIGFLDRGNRS